MTYVPLELCAFKQACVFVLHTLYYVCGPIFQHVGLSILSEEGALHPRTSVCCTYHINLVMPGVLCIHSCEHQK